MKLKMTILAAALCFLSVVGSQAQSYTNRYKVTLAWDASTSGTNITNYMVYWGVTSRVYTNSISTATNLVGVVSNLIPATTYFYAATAMDKWGLESDYSSEISNTTPRPKPFAPTTLRTNSVVEMP
jgi:hypothetical protein